MSEPYTISRGFPLPYGANRRDEGCNFSIFSKHATSVSICLFEPGSKLPSFEIALDPLKNKTGYIWHAFVEGIPKHYHYGFRIDGPYDPLKGHYFDNRCILLDPYAKLVCGPKEWGASLAHDKTHTHKGAIDPVDEFDWGDDRHPNIPPKDLIIYEMHVRGFTQDASSGVKQRGTFLGVIEKIPYLKTLGINAVELMPIFEFNERDNTRNNPKTGEPLFQYWGYSTVNFFSPMNRYGTADGNALTEFKMLVKALHAEGIEVILDVVYNHTAEGNQEGPVLSFKGIENGVYYMLGPNGEYYNFTGCGNTFNCNNPIVRHFILESLRYWVVETHVDGFRFDLASILVRDHDGIPLSKPPLVDAISQDPILSTTKLIAEAWDAGGLYQVGSFPGGNVWADWNGKYRDEVRKFIKGTDGEIGNFATRISGSEDLYGRGRSPINSINFITAHDGFTLHDLVSYNHKHNEENGEDNKDGSNSNDSWNCGVEGETEDETILTMRQRQMRNLHLALMVSQGIPMVLMGDEYGHTKFGNNNSWAIDSRLNWFLWDELAKKQDFFRFYKGLIAFRKAHPVLCHSRFLKDHDVFWHGKELNKPDWGSKSRFLAFTLPDRINGYELFIAFNASFEEVTFQIPEKIEKKAWKRLVDSSKLSPEDLMDEENAPIIHGPTYALPYYSSLVLKSSA